MTNRRRRRGIGGILATTGTVHLTVGRREFHAQVPDWFPADTDHVVVVSGVAELALSALSFTVWRQPARACVGAALGTFVVAIFPGNIAQFTEHKDGFGLDTDRQRFLRLFVQPMLIGAALAGGDITEARRQPRARHTPLNSAS